MVCLIPQQWHFTQKIKSLLLYKNKNGGMELTEEQKQRYSRHILLDDIGIDGQQKISNAKVLIIGTGGLGSPIALYLAAAGIGTIGLIDGDVVDLSNLQRQIIHTTQDLNVPKVISAKEKINKLNPDVQVVTYQHLFTAENALSIISDFDFVVDATDNFATKFLINDACVIAKKPFSHGGILRYQGETMTYVPGAACYRCLFHSSPPQPPAAGILGAIAGMLGTIQAAEILKYFTGVGDLLTNKLLTFNAKTMDFSKMNTKPSVGCPVCGENPSIVRL